jgi:hypothetical protein
MIIKAVICSFDIETVFANNNWYMVEISNYLPEDVVTLDNRKLSHRTPELHTILRVPANKCKNLFYWL